MSNKDSKLVELLITASIPVITTLFFTLLKFFGNQYLLHISLIIACLIIILALIGFSIKFLQDREKRWRTNKLNHEKLDNRLKSMQDRLRSIQKDIEINTKINILENQISYLKGRIK